MTNDDADHNPPPPPQHPGSTVPGTMARYCGPEHTPGLPDGPPLSSGVETDEVERQLKDAQFSEFYRAHVKPVMAFLMRHGASTAEAADIAQETMTKAYAGWDSIRDPRPWAYRVAAHAFAARGRARREVPVESVPEPSALLPDPNAATEWEMRHHTLWMLSQLPPRQRQVLAWTLDGFGTGDIAEFLGIAPGAVRAALMKARAAVAPLVTGRPNETITRDPGIGSHDHNALADQCDARGADTGNAPCARDGSSTEMGA